MRCSTGPGNGNGSGRLRRRLFLLNEGVFLVDTGSGVHFLLKFVDFEVESHEAELELLRHSSGTERR